MKLGGGDDDEGASRRDLLAILATLGLFAGAASLDEQGERVINAVGGGETPVRVDMSESDFEIIIAETREEAEKNLEVYPTLAVVRNGGIYIYEEA